MVPVVCKSTECPKAVRRTRRNDSRQFMSEQRNKAKGKDKGRSTMIILNELLSFKIFLMVMGIWTQILFLK